MGMCVSFSRELAVKAGIELKQLQNNPDYKPDPEYPDDPDYVKWCGESEECIKVPGTDFYIANGGVRVIVVIVGGWGGVYASLIAWLTQHGIEWEEF